MTILGYHLFFLYVFYPWHTLFEIDIDATYPRHFVISYEKSEHFFLVLYGTLFP